MADAFEYQDPMYSQKPEDDHDQASALQYAMMRALSTMMDKSLPAQVLEYDRAKNVVTVQPVIYRTDVDDNVYERAPIVGVQCLSIGGGGLHLNFPIAKGDLGWIITADRDIDLFKQSLAPTKPNTQRAHTLSDAWFIPDMFRKYTIVGENSNDVVLQSTDGNARIALNHDRALIAVGGTRIVVDGSSVTVTAGSATINAPTTINGNLKVNGAVESTGNIKSGGSMSAPGGGEFGGITVQSHTHTDSDGGNCSTPIG